MVDMEVAVSEAVPHLPMLHLTTSNLVAHTEVTEAVHHWLTHSLHLSDKTDTADMEVAVAKALLMPEHKTSEAAASEVVLVEEVLTLVLKVQTTIWDTEDTETVEAQNLELMSSEVVPQNAATDSY